MNFKQCNCTQKDYISLSFIILSRKYKGRKDLPYDYAIQGLPIHFETSYKNTIINFYSG